MGVARLAKLTIPIIMITVLAACNGSDSGENSNVAPDAIAFIEADNILVGDVVILDGSASTDPEGNTLSYEWSFLSVPADSTATLTDLFTDAPHFTVDKLGDYVAQLIVSDGAVSSAPAQVTVMAVMPPPTVTLTTPEPLSVATANPVTFSGTIDDPSATITVNGEVTTNNDGDFGIDISLEEGTNTVTIIATNNTGQVAISIGVVLKTLPGPEVRITSPSNNFLIGTIWDGLGAPPVDDIQVKVTGSLNTTNGPPTVLVNGVVATIKSPDVIIQIGTPDLDGLYTFSADILLSKGRQQTITVIGTDTLGGSTTIRLTGTADYCVRGNPSDFGVAGVRSETSSIQNVRCHEINGCNRDQYAREGPIDTNSQRNQPMPNASRARFPPVEFGSGYFPGDGIIDLRNDAFIHGLAPSDPLGCNFHDTCYQTCVPGGADGNRFNTPPEMKACNDQQQEHHLAECRSQYPASCPFSGLRLRACADWKLEKARCYRLAGIYRTGVRAAGKTYVARQNDYCINP